MGYFCVECGAFQRIVARACPECGAEREDPTRINPFARSRRGGATTDAEDELPAEVVSRRRYMWFNLTRRWRRVWVRGLIWRTLLIAGSTIVIGGPLAGATYWLVGQRCDSSQDVACSSTVVRLVTPVSADFARELSTSVNEKNLALAAELYDTVTLIGLAWADDETVSKFEVFNISAGKRNICSTAVECIPFIRLCKNIGYNGVSGSVPLNADGMRGTHLTNQQHRKPAALTPEARGDRFLSVKASQNQMSDARIPGTFVSVIVRRNATWASEAAGLAANGLEVAGVNLGVRVETPESTIESLGAYVVVFDSTIPDYTLRLIEASGRLVITLGSEWRVIPDSRTWLRLSPHPAMLTEMVVRQLRFDQTVVVVNRCGGNEYTKRLIDASGRNIMRLLQRRLIERGSRQVVRYQCIGKVALADPSTALIGDTPITLVVATAYDPLGLLKTMLESGYIGKVEDVIVVAPRITRLVETLTQPSNP